MIAGFRSHGQQTAHHLDALLPRTPDFAMGHAARGLFCLMTACAKMLVPGRATLQSAKATAGQETPREAGWIAAMAHWLVGRPTQAIAAVEGVFRHHPSDTLSAKPSHGIRFMLDDSARLRRSVKRVLDAHGADHPCRSYLLGCRAFALQENDAYEGAETTGRERLELARDDAHVYEMAARPDDGIRLIEDKTLAWSASNNFRYHLCWGKAVLHPELGEQEIAQAFYDYQIPVNQTDDYRDIANATSLLMRLEQDGADVGNRWEVLANFAQARVENTGLAVLAGLNAFAEGRYDTAFPNLAAARPDIPAIGGCHAQRDVFERITIDAGLRAGRYGATEAILRDRLRLHAGCYDRSALSRPSIIDHARRIPAQ